MLNGMKIYIPKTKSGKFSPYNNQLVIIVAKEKTMGKVYLTGKVEELLGNPEFVHVGARGSNLYIWKATAQDMRGYRVSRNEKKKSSMRWININSAVKENNIHAGIYRAVFDDGMISFDFYQVPSRLD